jgi:D-aminopeptidase
VEGGGMTGTGAAPRARLRDLGLRVGRFEPGTHNAITDVAGVRVGHFTRRLPATPGGIPVNTGVTAVLPADGDVFLDRVPAATFVLNGAGELTGRAQLDEWGLCETPILLTSTLCVGRVADAAVSWMLRAHPTIGREHDVVIPVVAECDDSWLDDAPGRHLAEADVFAALDGARGGPVEQGSVGAGAGMMTFHFAGGIGTSSRALRVSGRDGVLGALVLSNFGEVERLRIDGVPVGAALAPTMAGRPRRGPAGSLIVLCATDLPLGARQLGRLCRRAALAVSRTGGYAADNSGEIMLAWSTAQRVARKRPGHAVAAELLHDGELNPLFEAAVDVVEESILDAICAGTETIGPGDRRAPALPLEDVRRLVRPS